MRTVIGVMTIARWAKPTVAVAVVLMLVGCARTCQELAPDIQLAQADEIDGERVLREAKAKINSVPSPPTTRDMEFFPRHHLEAAEEIWRGVLEEQSALPRAWVALGRCQMRLGKYGAAVKSFGEALKISPDDAAAQAGRRRARKLLGVAQAVQLQLPSGQEVIQVDELKAGKHERLWLVLCGKMSEDEFPFERFSEVHLNLYQETGERLTRTWQYRLRGHSDSSGSFDIGLGDVQFYVLDLTDDGSPEVAVGQVVYGASWAPSHLDVFAWRGHQLAKILGVDSNFPGWIKHINDDGCYEVVGHYCIGWSLCHAEMPYWEDIYAYKNGRYVLANEDFPEEFDGWADELQQVLKEHPDDWEILKYLGIVQEIEGRSDEALAAYCRAEKACRAEMVEWKDDLEFRTRLKGELKDIQRRIGTLSG